MNSLLFVFIILSACGSAVFYFAANDGQRGAQCMSACLKLSFIWMLLSGIVPILAAALAATGVLIVFVMARSAGLPGGKKELALFVTAIAAVFIFAQGCSIQGGRMPEKMDEMKLDYTPSSIRASLFDNNVVYAGTERDRVVYAYDMSSKTINATIAAGYMPVDIIQNGRSIITANRTSNSVTIHDLRTGKSEQVQSGGEYPSAVAYNPARNEVYVTNIGSNNVAVIDLSGNTPEVVARILTGKWPSDLYLAPDNRYLYVSCKYTNTVQIIDTQRRLPVFTKVDTGISPSRLLPISKREIAVINEWEYAFNRSSSILIFNRINYGLEYDILVDGGIFDAALSKSGRYLYVTVPPKDKVIFVDLKKREKVYELKFRDEIPKWLTVSKDGRTLYVATQQSKRIYYISVNSLL
ncbi:MAG: beta-propeller fold lactonase family protein [Spirochaetia bacterium]|nr:beta-propeller fold lactonase family protein [Spirochaetia bacterium]